jgi:diacylglycerol kinase (ATP)
VQRVIELSQRIVVEKSVINQNEQVQKTSEVSVENSKRIILSDNNFSSSSMSYEKSHERTLETNGLLQNSEKFCDKGCIVENEVCNDGNREESEETNEGTSEDFKSQPKTSSSCNDLLMFGKSQMIPLSPKDDVMPISASDFSIPYNIINNYFSGA